MAEKDKDLNSEKEIAKKINILVVDDEGIMRQLLADVLKDAGYNVWTAESGEEALKIAEKMEFEVVLTDLRMPGMTGIEVLKKFKEKNTNICVIVITAYASVESAVEAMKIGAYDYITKPFNLEEIKIIIGRAMERQFLLEEAKQKDKYKELSIVDGLTGLYNHRHFHEQLSVELNRSTRSNNPLSLILIDIDDFKKYNDAFGHLAGDQILKQIADIFLSVTRKVDIVARYGGEEFAVLLPETGKQEASSLARRIRGLVDQAHFGRAGAHLTVSVGLATFPQDAQDKNEMIKKADETLYQAKRLGKNRVCFF